MVKPGKIRNQPRSERLNIYFTKEELAQIKENADQSGLPVSVMVRKIALAQQIRPARSRASQELISTLNKLGGELNKVGSNLNQLARQADSDEYPDKGSILHVLSSVRNTVDQIVLAIKKV